MTFKTHGKTPKVVQIDRKDWGRVREFRWHLIACRRTPGLYYAATSLWNPYTQTSHKLLLHRFLLPGFPRLDHRNGDGLDCRRANLRPASLLQNLWNRPKPKHNTSGRKGVARNWRRGGVWVARITVYGKQKWLGSFKRRDDAARAYDAAARKFFGEFARTNFDK